MAITKSGKKAHRQSLKRAVVNQRRSKALKLTIKDVRESIAKKDTGSAATKLHLAYAAIDKSARAGIIKKGTANRKKSRLAKALAKASK